MARGKSTFLRLIADEGPGKGTENYTTIVNKRTTPKLRLRKYCPKARAHVWHISKETKS